MLFLPGYPVNAPVMRPYGLVNGRLHHGIDYQTPLFTPVKASGAGKVMLQGMTRCGLAAIIHHGDGIATMYFPLQRSFVQPGEAVRFGQVIGRSARHLHFGFIMRGSSVDPDKAIALGIDRETGEINHPRLIKSVLATTTLAGIMFFLEG